MVCTKAVGVTFDRQRAAVVAAARTWVGCRFVMNACVAFTGVDCARFPWACYRTAGVPMPALLPILPRDWHCHRNDELYLQTLDGFFREIPGPPQPGDLAVFHFGRVFSHGAIVVNWPDVIHAYWSSGVTEASAEQEPLVTRAARFFSPWG